MGRRVTVCLISLVFLFCLPSCKPKTSGFKTMYESGDYESVISKAGDLLEYKMDKDALYYKAMSEYKVGDMQSSVKSATLYSVLYSSEKDEKVRDTLRILLFYGDRKIGSFDPGDLLHSSYEMSKEEYEAYFVSLMDSALYEKANSIYLEIEGKLTKREKAMMLIHGKASSDLIISILDSMHAEEGESEEYISTLTEAAKMMNERGEGMKIMQLLIESYGGGRNEVSLMIGDIYFKEGVRDRAIRYWTEAYASFPDEVRERLTTSR